MTQEVPPLRLINLSLEVKQTVERFVTLVSSEEMIKRLRLSLLIQKPSHQPESLNVVMNHLNYHFQLDHPTVEIDDCIRIIDSEKTLKITIIIKRKQ